MEFSSSIAALSKALAAAQSELANPLKKSPGNYGMYADLAEVLAAARPILSKNGLAVTQHPGYEDGRVTVTTLLLHESGEWMKSVAACDAPAASGRSSAQAVGSVITYLRRYALAAVVGIAQEDDVDAIAANGSSGQSKSRSAAPRSAPPRSNGTSDEDRKAAIGAINESGTIADLETATQFALGLSSNPGWQKMVSDKSAARRQALGG